MHARLVQHHVRKFRQPVLDVLHPSAAHDVLALLLVRLPERRLVDPAGLLQRRARLKPKASNISIVRQAMPSAWPRSSGPGFCSTMQVLMSGKADSCAASVKPAGPQPTMRISTSCGMVPDAPDAGYAVRDLRSPGRRARIRSDEIAQTSAPSMGFPRGPDYRKRRWLDTSSHRQVDHPVMQHLQRVLPGREVAAELRDRMRAARHARELPQGFSPHSSATGSGSTFRPFSEISSIEMWLTFHPA